MPTDNVVSSTTGLSTDELDPPLADIAFLVRSNHRVRVLEELATDERTRRGLHEKPAISQPTLGRVLDGFQEREWVDENGRAYTLTPFGRLLVDEFEDLMETAETIQQLRDLAPRLPLDDAGVPCAFIEIENGSVRAAISTTLDSYREQSKEVTVETLSE